MPISPKILAPGSLFPNSPAPTIFFFPLPPPSSPPTSPLQNPTHFKTQLVFSFIATTVAIYLPCCCCISFFHLLLLPKKSKTLKTKRFFVLGCFCFFLGEVFGLGWVEVGWGGRRRGVRGLLNAQVLVLLCLGVVPRADQSLLEFSSSG
jgi:hypothetical protein